MEEKNEEVWVEESDLTETPKPEIVTAGDDLGMPTFNSDEELTMFLEKYDRRNTAIDTITRASLKKLAPTDFHDFGGKPLLQGVGAQRLLKYFGISVTDIKRIPLKGYDMIEEDTAQRLRVSYRARFKLGSMVIEGEGIRDSHNKFFCKTEDGFKEIADINLPDLDRSARTSMYRDGVSTLLGLKGLTWQYLKELGFTPDQTTGHTYKTGSQGGSAAGPDQDTKNMQTEIANMIFEMTEGDTEESRKKCVEFSEYTYKDKGEDKLVKGIESPSKLTAARAKKTHAKVKEAHDKYIKNLAGETPDTSDEAMPALGF